MAARRGINLLDILNLPGAANTLIPDSLASQLENFSVIDYRTTSSDSAFVHYGTVQALSDSLDLPALRSWPVQIPGIHSGIPFQLTFQRVAVTESLEPAADRFNLDLFLDRVSITVPGLKPAKRVASAPLSPRHLVPDTSRETVRIYGSGVLRLSPDVSGNLVALLIDAPDPLDPGALTGAVYTLGFEPPHFFLGDSSIGLTVDQLTYDDSSEYTPEAIVARGQSSIWQGIAIREATVYLPRNCPYIGDVSVGVRDVLLGSPTGMQGEVQLELGRTPVSPDTLTVEQQIVTDDEHTETVSLPLNGSGERDRTVQLHPSTEETAQIRARFTDSAATGEADWTLPDGTDLQGQATPFFTTRAGEVLRYRGIETAEDGSEAVSPEVALRFETVDTETAYAPKITLRLGEDDTYANVVHLSGSHEQLQGLEFIADPLDPADIDTVDERLVWRFGQGSELQEPDRFQQNVDGRDRIVIRLNNLPTEPGQYRLFLQDAQNRRRYVLIELLPAGNLIIGGGDGACDRSGSIDITGRPIESVYALRPFHDRGVLEQATGAEVEGAPNSLGVAAGTLKEFVLGRGTPSDPDEVVTPPSETEQQEQQTIREVRILMDTGETVPQGWVPGPHQPQPSQGYTDAALFAWINSFPADTQFYIIGRCDDLWRGLNTPADPDADVTDPRAETKNAQLARDRAAAIEAIVTQQVDGSRVFARGEQDAWSSSVPAGVPTDTDWLIRSQHPEFTTWGRNPSDQALIRQQYRRVEIHAVGSTVTGDSDSSTALRPVDPSDSPPARRRVIIPGEDLTTQPPFTPREPVLPYRVRLTVRWDSPTVVEPADAIPTQAEVLIQWDNGPVEIPGSEGETLPPVTENGARREVLTFTGTWSYDARSGLTVFSLAIDSAGDPKGLFDPIESNTLALALGFGPALMAALPSSDVEGDVAKLAGLVVASAILGNTVVQDGKVAIYRIEAEQTLRSLDTLENSRLQVSFDYSAEMGFDTSSLGLPINIRSSQPIRVRYKNVAVEVDDSREGLDKFGLVYDDVSFEIEDPGQWTIDGELGQLLSVTDARSGTGSVWYELDLAFALDLGVIALTGATIRLTFQEGGGGVPEFELRGLAASVNIPGALKGSGSVSMGSGGTFRAGINASIIPADIKAAGSLAYNAEKEFFFIQVALILSAGIPLGPTGLGLYGFVGRFVSNGQRSFGEVPFDEQPGEPVQKEIDWHQHPPEQKYAPKQGQWSLGLGAVVGTLPDTAFTFNALGMFTLGLPDPEVIFGIDARFVSKPELPAEQADGAARSFRLIGIVAIDDTAIKLGIRGEFEIEQLLTLKVPISAYYPYSGDGYLRIGSDGFEGRLGDPVTLTILPEILDIRAWSYLMIEEGGLQKLGNNPDFSFDGFSVGFGAGWEIRWSAGPIKLEASAKVLAGIGTNPLMLVAGVFVRGELSLVVVSISATGEIVLKLKGDENRLDGRFCGKVDLFFFSIEGCVGISIGSDPGEAIPPPASPLLKVDLTDRRGVVAGRARLAGRTGSVTETPSLPADASLPERAWPDTVPVIHFAHWLDTALEAGSDFSGLGQAAPSPPWSGTSELKYAYRLVSVRLRVAGSAEPIGENLEAVWWLPTYRGGVISGADDPAASDQEGRLLALLSWHPAPWARVLDLSETDTLPPGDPANTLEDVCDPTPAPQRVCVLGSNLTRLDLDDVELRTNGPSPAPFSSNFKILGRESAGSVDLETALTIYEEMGRHLVPGRKEGLLGSTEARSQIYRLPYVALRDRISTTLYFDGQLVPAITQPELLLVACFSRKTETPLPNADVCDRYGDLQVGQNFTRLEHSRITYVSRSIRVVDIMPLQGEPELMFAATGMNINLPAFTAEVTLRLAQFTSQPITAEALQSNGTVVASQTTPQTQGTEHRIVLRGQGISAVRLSGGGGEGLLMGLCYQTKQQGGGFQDPEDLPQVYGVTQQGERQRWALEPSQPVRLETETCVFLRYRPDAASRDQGWQRLQIQPWPYGKVFVYSCCGVTEQAATAAERDQQYRDQLQQDWNHHAGAPGSDDAVSEHPYLLAADTDYELEVTWEWQGWRKSEDQPAPPAPSMGSWTRVSETYRFSTAQPTTDAQLSAPVDFIREAVFDPRNVLRYLIGFEPATPELPHFLEDPLYVDFLVDYLEPLLARYGYGLTLRLQLTTPAAGTLSEPGFTLDTPLVVNWQPLLYDLIEGSDQRLIQAAAAVPCLETPSLGGTSAEITAELQGRAGYDLILVAAGLGAGQSDVVLARSHFRTSRYANGEALLTALGFFQGDANTLLPGDVVLTDVPAVPTTPVLDSDSALDATLRDLGLDPWPLPTQPRTTVLWRFDGDWRLAGVLIETDEPTERSGRQMRDAQLQRTTRLSLSHAQLGSTRLNPVRRNQSTTRILLAPNSPVAVPVGAVLSLVVEQPGGPLSGNRELIRGPRMAYREGLL